MKWSFKIKELPNEILCHLLLLLSMRDILRFMRINKAFFEFVRDNDYFWKQHWKYWSLGAFRGDRSYKEASLYYNLGSPIHQLGYWYSLGKPIRPDDFYIGVLSLDTGNINQDLTKDSTCENYPEINDIYLVLTNKQEHILLRGSQKHEETTPNFVFFDDEKMYSYPQKEEHHTCFSDELSEEISILIREGYLGMAYYPLSEFASVKKSIDDQETTTNGYIVTWSKFTTIFDDWSETFIDITDE